MQRTYGLLLTGEPVAFTYSDQVHAAASCIPSMGKYPMSTRRAGSSSYVTERRSLRPRISTIRMIAIRELRSNMNQVPGSMAAWTWDIGDQCCTTSTTVRHTADSRPSTNDRFWCIARLLPSETRHAVFRCTETHHRNRFTPKR